MLQTKMMTGFSLKDKEILEVAGKVSKISFELMIKLDHFDILDSIDNQ